MRPRGRETYNTFATTRSASRNLSDRFAAGQCRVIIGKEIDKGNQGHVFDAIVYELLPRGTKTIPCVAKRLVKTQNTATNSLPAEFQLHQIATQSTISTADSGLLGCLGIHTDANTDTQFLIMPKGGANLQGCSPALDALRGKNPLLFQHVMMDIIESMGRALTTLNRLELVHGDIKPANIVIYNGAWCLIDFGVSETHYDFRDSKKPNGSPFYMAPEIIAGEKHHPHAGDIYSLGVVIRQLLGMPDLFSSNSDNVYSLSFAKGNAFNTAVQNDSRADLQNNSQDDFQDLEEVIEAINEPGDCLAFIADKMCENHPAHRPNLSELHFAFQHLQTLLKNTPVHTNAVAEFYIEMLHPAKTTARVSRNTSVFDSRTPPNDGNDENSFAVHQDKADGNSPLTDEGYPSPEEMMAAMATQGIFPQRAAQAGESTDSLVNISPIPTVPA